MARRKERKLSKAMDGRLKTYSLMAMAAGVGVAAGTVPAEGQIVYTPAHVELNQKFEMDLNKDGLNDFNLIPWGSASIGGSLRTSWLDVCHSPAEGSHACVQSSSSAQANKDNVVLTTGDDAAALTAGAAIGPAQQFIGTGQPVYMGGRVFYSLSSVNTKVIWNGPWVNSGNGVTNRYLGLKFKINGQFHYGWARISLEADRRPGFNGGFVAFLQGYAYETVANKAIRAGQTVEAKAAEGRGPSLGALAAGADGLPSWRNSVEVEQNPKQ